MVDKTSEQLIESGELTLVNGTLFHVSDTFLGETMVLTPRIPRWVQGEEPEIPRVCFSTNVVDCVIASGCFVSAELFVYKTRKPIDAYAVSSLVVEDAEINKECWSLIPVEVEFVKAMGILEIRKLANNYFQAEKKRNSFSVELTC